MPHRRWYLRPRSLIGLAVLIFAAGYLAWRDAPFHAPAGGMAASQHGKRPAPIPVTVQTARASDFPVYLKGLGTVAPYNTVTVRSRVDGQVVKVGFRQGQMVKAGDLLVQIDPRPYQAVLEQAQAKKAQDEASLRNAKRDLQRYSTLAERDFASRQQLDTQQAMVEQLTAQIKGDQATIDNATTQLSYTTIRSPLTGKTGFRLIDPGNIVHASDTTGIVTIVKLQPISVVFTAPEEEVGKLNAALAAGKVPVTALSSDGLKVLAHGHLALVDNQVDQASGTIRMKATFQNKDNALWPGLSVSTRLLVETLRNVIVVPTDAVQHGPNGLYAFVIGNDKKAAIRAIKVGDENVAQTVVTQGLAVGERVVVGGQYRLTPGAIVDAREPKTPPAAGGEKQVRNTARASPPQKEP